MSRDHAVDKYTFTARPLHEVITENATRGLWMLLAATSLLLLIACTNVANLLLARAVVRERDLAIRASLGAGRARLFGQVMGETIALGIARQRRRHRPGVGVAAHLRVAGAGEFPAPCGDHARFERARLLARSSRSSPDWSPDCRRSIHLLRSDLNA